MSFKAGGFDRTACPELVEGKEVHRPACELLRLRAETFAYFGAVRSDDAHGHSSEVEVPGHDGVKLASRAEVSQKHQGRRPVPHGLGAALKQPRSGV